MPKHFLAINSGSSSLKAAAFELNPAASDLNLKNENRPHWSSSESIDLRKADAGHCLATIDKLIQDFESKCSISRKDIEIIGHRVVHGAAALTKTTRITSAVESEIEKACELAPVHNPVALKIIRAARELFPELPQYAVFDTAFHSTLPESAYLYPVPYRWYESWGIRRYGFHGINHSYCSKRAISILQRETPVERLISCHLGNGCSVAAVYKGKSVDTSMGFTPLEGLMMGSRSGSIDPGIIFYLQREKKMHFDQIEIELNNESGLLGVSGLSKDMREIESNIDKGNERAKLAFELFVQRAAQEIATMCVSLGGIDVLVFTGGIGEHSERVRVQICNKLHFLGIVLESTGDSSDTADNTISKSESPVTVLRIAANEEFEMLKEIWELRLSQPS